MRCKQFAIHHNVSSRGTKIGSGPCSFLSPAQNLAFDADGEILIPKHGMRILSMEHGTTVSPRPALAPGRLFSHESIFNCEIISRERFFIKKMTVLLVKIIISIIIYNHFSILHRESVLIIFTDFMLPDLGNPAIEIVSVEKLLPFRLVGI